jgi:phytoene synthase
MRWQLMPQNLDLTYCAEQVRIGDHDRFLTALFAPADRREHLFSLFAFNLELARIAESVREPMLGAIRLQWWREAVEDARHGTVRRNPTVEAIAAVIDRMPQALVEGMIDARALDFSDEPPASFNELVEYAAETGGAVTELAAHILSGQDAGQRSLRAVCREVGIGWTLVGIVRAVPFHAARGRVLLPSDLLAEEGVAVRDILEGRSGPALCRIVGRIVDEAARRLSMARVGQGRGRVARAVLPALLPAALADLYIGSLRRSACDPFQTARRPSVPRLQMRLLRKAVTSRF